MDLLRLTGNKSAALNAEPFCATAWIATLEANGRTVSVTAHIEVTMFIGVSDGEARQAATNLLAN